jgi:hypothetical protein
MDPATILNFKLKNAYTQGIPLYTIPLNKHRICHLSYFINDVACL